MRTTELDMNATLLFPDGCPSVEQARRTALWRAETFGHLAIPLVAVAPDTNRGLLLADKLALPTTGYAIGKVGDACDTFTVQSAADLNGQLEIVLPDLNAATIEDLQDLFVYHHENPAPRARPWHAGTPEPSFTSKNFELPVDVDTNYTTRDADGLLWARTDWFAADGSLQPVVGETVTVGNAYGTIWSAYIETFHGPWVVMRLVELVQ